MERSVQNALSANDCLDNELIDSFEQIFGLSFTDIEWKEILKWSETPFTSKVFFILAWLQKLCIFFVDAVICEMLIFPVLRVFWQVIVNLSRKTSKTLLVNVNPQRVNPCDCHVNSEIELKPINEQRVIYVMTHNQWGISLKFGLNDFQRCGYRNSFALWTIMRLCDVRVLVFLHLIFEQVVLFREDVGLW